MNDDEIIYIDHHGITPDEGIISEDATPDAAEIESDSRDDEMAKTTDAPEGDDSAQPDEPDPFDDIQSKIKGYPLPTPETSRINPPPPPHGKE